jgi:hypothetical protein
VVFGRDTHGICLSAEPSEIDIQGICLLADDTLRDET